jgi:hypothetical protein
MRADGRKLKTADPMFKMMPHLMPKRYDAQVFFKTDIDYTNTRKYINAKRKEGICIHFMSMFFTAYLHAIALYPQLNRFIINKTIYARKEVWISFMILRNIGPHDEPDEAVIKVKLEFTDTIFDVSKKINNAIKENREANGENVSDKIVSGFMNIPLLSGLAINIGKLMDKIGLLPKMIIDGSPFHTSLFLTNLTSLKLDTVYHHIYDFGTTSTFISMGSLENNKTTNGEQKNTISMGMVLDERICAGVTFAKGLSQIKKLIANPKLLEFPPRLVRQDIK